MSQEPLQPQDCPWVLWIPNDCRGRLAARKFIFLWIDRHMAMREFKTVSPIPSAECSHLSVHNRYGSSAFSLRGTSGPSNRAMNYVQIRCVVNECCAEGGLIRRHEWLWKERQGQSEEEKRGMCTSLGDHRGQHKFQISHFVAALKSIEILIN